MGCNCKKRTGNRFQVTLPGGLKVTKSTEEAATAFAAKHPGSTVQKIGATK